MEYFTQFCKNLDLGSADNVTRAIDMFEKHQKDALESNPGDENFIESYEFECTQADDENALRIEADEYGSPEHVAVFVSELAETLGLTGGWGMTWANTASRPVVDAFDGGAFFIDFNSKEPVKWLSPAGWIDEQQKAVNRAINDTHNDARHG